MPELRPVEIEDKVRVDGVLGYIDQRGNSCTALFMRKSTHLHGQYLRRGKLLHWIDGEGQRWTALFDNNNHSALIESGYSVAKSHNAIAFGIVQTDNGLNIETYKVTEYPGIPKIEMVVRDSLITLGGITNSALLRLVTSRP